MDFDSPAAAQKAVASLKASGVQAQMAKVSVALVCRRFTSCFSCRQGVFLQHRRRCLVQLPWLQACRGAETTGGKLRVGERRYSGSAFEHSVSKD